MVCTSCFVGGSYMLRRRSRVLDVVGAEELGTGRWLPVGRVECVGPGWKGWRPRGVSTMTRKWPVNGGPTVPGTIGTSACASAFPGSKEPLPPSRRTAGNPPAAGRTGNTPPSPTRERTRTAARAGGRTPDVSADNPSTSPVHSPAPGSRLRSSAGPQDFPAGRFSHTRTTCISRRD